MVIRTGVLGYSEGNGHPFSFSAIVNGYDTAAFEQAGWPGILEYLQREPAERFGIGEARITCAWTQDPRITGRLCAACKIARACNRPDDMLGQVDAVIVARDDWETHAGLALPFLQHGLPVFVDKPLSLSDDDLVRFEPYLRTGKLMSCSGLRFARELDSVRNDIAENTFGIPRFISATVLNGMEKYGIHLLEAVAGLSAGFGTPRSVARLETPHEAFLMHFRDGTPFILHCLGAVAKTFHLSVFGERGHRHADLHDNFGAFRRTLERFFAMVSDARPPIDPDETLALMALLARARSLRPGESASLGPREHVTA